MSGAAGWAALAGLANYVGNRLESDREFEQKKQLYQMQQDAEMKRQQFLEQYKQQLQDQTRQADYDRKKNDVVSQFKDPETGNYYGRTKTGDVIPLNKTSDDYQGDLADHRDLNNDKLRAQTDLSNARVDETNARTGLIGKQGQNIDSLVHRRNQLEGDSKSIRNDYMKLMSQAQNADAKLAAAAKKDGTDYTPIDPGHIDTAVRAKLYSVYGGQAVSNALGGNSPQTTASVAPAASPPQQTSPTQPAAPSVEQLLAQANAAAKAVGNDPQKQAAIEARLKQLMVQYGYQPQ